MSELKILEKLHPPRKPSALFPHTLTRKQYLIRILIVVAVVAAAFLFFVGAPTDIVRFASVVYVIVLLLAFLYHIFGLALPRLKNAKLTFLWVLLALVPFGVVVLILICATAPEKA